MNDKAGDHLLKTYFPGGRIYCKLLKRAIFRDDVINTTCDDAKELELGNRVHNCMVCSSRQQNKPVPQPVRRLLDAHIPQECPQCHVPLCCGSQTCNSCQWDASMEVVEC